MERNEATVTDVAAELDEIGQRLIERTFMRVGTKGPLELPILFRLAEHHFPDEWQQDRIDALKALIRTAILRVSETAVVEKSTTEPKMSLRQAACMMFNISAPEYGFKAIRIEELEGKKYSALLERLKNTAGIYVSVARVRADILTSLRRILAEELLQPGLLLEGTDEASGVPGDDGQGGRYPLVTKAETFKESGAANFDARYAVRTEIHAQFKAAMKAGAKCILLAGPAGMEKTRLAAEIPKEYACTDEILHLRADTGESLSFDVLAAMHKYGLVSRIPSTNSVNHCMAELLASPQGPSFTIIDNVESPSQLLNVVPSSLHSTVIATCRTSTRLPDEWSVINVGRMTEDESCDMIAKVLPHLHRHEVRDLAAQLHGYALVTKYVCLLLEHGHLSATDFIREFGRSRSRFLTKVPSGREELLGDVLKRVREQVRHRSTDADFLLSCLGTIKDICGSGPDVSHNYLSACLQISHGTIPSLGKITLEYIIAFRMLQDFGFVERENLGCIETHPLISELLADLAEDNWADAYDYAIIREETYATARSARVIDVERS